MLPKNQFGFTLVGNDEYITTQDTIYYWVKGGVQFRLIILAGQNTDLMSSPKFARILGFKKEDPRTWLASIIHDWLCHKVRYYNGILPPGSYQAFLNGEWVNCHEDVWTYKDADQFFEKILIESGVPVAKAKAAYLSLRLFGWAYRLTHR